MTQSKSKNERQIEAGGLIYREGDPGDAVFVIQEGEVEILRETNGEVVRLAVLSRGAIFCEMGVLRDKPRSTTVRALQETKMIVLSKPDFLDAFGDENNSLALRLLRMLCGCPSSKYMGPLSLFHNGGFGSSWIDVKPLGADGSSGGFGWSVF